MKKKFFSLLLILAVCFTLSAADTWWKGKIISGFGVSGLKNIGQSEVNKKLYPFRGEVLSEEVYNEIQGAMYTLEGIDYISTAVTPVEGRDSDVRVDITFYELPKISEIIFVGNSKVKKSDLTDGIVSVKAGDFCDISKRAVLDAVKAEIQGVYLKKGFDTIPVTVTAEENTFEGTVTIRAEISEGLQTRVTGVGFEGNFNASSSILKKQLKTKVKGLLQKGLLDYTNLDQDADAIVYFYKTFGYVDAVVKEIQIEPIDNGDPKFQDVSIIYIIDEGLRWYYGGMKFTGNTIYSDETIADFIRMKEGSILNMQEVEAQYNAVADLYYNNGYISNIMDVKENRDDTTMTIDYEISITEGPQAYIEQIVISGLTKTKDYVMRREIELKPGEVFSKAKLITSAQNLFNTGLLEDVNYDIYYGTAENNIIVEFMVKEGKQMDIQFGATFGGNVNGFPVSGFLQWSSHNTGGRGLDLNVSTTLSPDNQSVAVSFGDKWLFGKRWSNSISLSFSHAKYDDTMQRGAGSDFYDGRNESEVYPLGFNSADEWARSNNRKPTANYLMEYKLWTIGLGLNTGYTFIYDVGRLSVNGGLSFSINKADYNHNLYTPFNYLTYQYGQGAWKFSNKLSASVQWDGRDYITNTTKGYVVGFGATYAGGFLGGLSNYVKFSGDAAGFIKLFEVGAEDKRKNIMMSLATNAAVMLPQYYNH
ncbi:MAG: outer membrane protein assembly factor BamA, partial [Sphaerochaetaceae bacterium]|nr:outer membrane protein assembly factor BamA [Sphaerochaetaceae bacterium]